MKNSEKHGIGEIYKFYKDKYPEEECIEYKKFAAIIKEFNKELSRQIIDKNVEFIMPVRLGSVRIRKYKKRIQLNPDGSIKKNRFSVNWKSTIELWNRLYPGKSKEELKAIKNKQVVYHLNEHTEGYAFMLYWNKRGSNAINRSVYSIKMIRRNDRHLAELLKSNASVNYYE